MRPLRLVSAYISYYIIFFNEMTRVLMKQFPDMVNPGMTLSYVKKFETESFHSFYPQNIGCL